LLAKYRYLLMIGGIALAGMALLAILLVGRFLQPSSLRAAQTARRAEADPLTQSVPAAMETPTKPLPASTAVKTQQIPSRAKKVTAELKLKAADAPAAFLRVNPDGQVLPTPPIPVLEQETVFGADPTQCGQILDDPSVSPVHARLRLTEDGGFLLLDNNSVAGTWVNYELIPREGYRLAHGDMVNFGQVVYRFVLRTAPATSKPTVRTPEE